MAFTSLRDLLIKNAARFQSRNEAVLLSMDEVWDDVVKEFNIDSLTNPRSYKKGILIISCLSLSEASHLKLQKERIKTKINQLLKKELVKEVQFRVIHTNNL